LALLGHRCLSGLGNEEKCHPIRATRRVAHAVPPPPTAMNRISLKLFSNIYSHESGGAKARMRPLRRAQGNVLKGFKGKLFQKFSLNLFFFFKTLNGFVKRGVAE